MLPDVDRNRLLRHEDFKLRRTSEKLLTAAGNEIIRQYTTKENWWCTRINLLLATDLLTDEHPEYADFAKQLKCCIGWQTPKWKGYVYRGALHCPLELFVFAFKRRFYIPSFTSSSIDPNALFANAWFDGAPAGNFQNVKFEINTSEYPNFTTIIKDEQTKYKSEKECLISCYNIFEWVGYRFEKGWPIVTLKILNYERYNDSVDQLIKEGTTAELPLTWMEKKGEIPRSRKMTPAQLNYNLCSLFRSYQKNYGKMEWLNADFGPEEGLPPR